MPTRKQPPSAATTICNNVYNSKEMQQEIRQTWLEVVVPKYKQITGKAPDAAYQKHFMKGFKQQVMERCRNRVMAKFKGMTKRQKRKRNKHSGTRRRR